MKTTLLWIIAALLAVGFPARAAQPARISAEDQRPGARPPDPGSSWEAPDKAPRWRLAVGAGIFSFLSQNLELQDEFSSLGYAVEAERRLAEGVALAASFTLSRAESEGTSLSTHAAALELVLRSESLDDPHAYLGAGPAVLHAILDDGDSKSSLGAGPSLLVGYWFPLGKWMGIQAQARALYARATVEDVAGTDRRVNFSNLSATLAMAVRF